MTQVLAYLCGSESWGGLEMNHVRNAVWMRDRGHTVVYFCIEHSKTHTYAQEFGLTLVFVQKHKKYYDFKRGRELVLLLKKHQVTHLLIRSNADVSLLAYAKYKLKEKLHTSYFMEMQLGVRKKNLLHTFRYRYIDLWSCPLNYLADQVKTMTNFRNRLVVIPSGIDLSRFKSMDKSEARLRLGLPESQFLFGIAGRFDPQKGQLLLLEAMSKCTSTNFAVVFLGEPTLHEDGTQYFESMQNVIKQNNLSDRVIFRPFMAEIELFYSAIDWFVMATKAETFGMVTLESLACGTPVLGSNAGGTPELLGFGEFGVLFQPMNAADLSDKIDEILEDRLVLSVDTLNEAIQQYSHMTVSAQIEQELKLKNV